MAGALTLAFPNLPTEERLQIVSDALQRYQRGETVLDISASLGIEPTTLYRAFLAEREQDWKDAKITHALVAVENAEKGIVEAQDNLALLRARATADLARWHLERLMRRLYGQDAPGAQVAVQVNVNLSRESVAEIQHAAVLPPE